MSAAKTALNPCPECGLPAMIVEGLGGTWQIGCFRKDCGQTPVRYQADNKRSRAAAVRTWNSGKKQQGEG